jgi:hypothetical protein
MPKRKRGDTAAPPGPTEPAKPSPLRDWLERELRRAEREAARKRKRLKAAFPWFQPLLKRTPNLPPEVERELQTKLPADATEEQRKRRLLLQQWARQVYDAQLEDREVEATERALEQRLEQQERERGRAREKRRIRKLERETQELERRLEAVRAAVETKADDTVELAQLKAKVKTLAEHGSAAGKRSGERRRAKQEAWETYAAGCILALADANQKLSREAIGGRILNEWSADQAEREPVSLSALMTLMAKLAKAGKLRARRK